MRTCVKCEKKCTSRRSRCSRCKTVFFCDEVCQKEFWASHKDFCSRVAKPYISQCPTTPPKTCVIIDFLGIEANPKYIKRVREYLSNAGLHVIVIDASKGNFIARQVALILTSTTLSPTALVLIGFGSSDIGLDFYNETVFKEAVTKWCKEGGCFIVNGERLWLFNWPAWFDRDWTDDGVYSRKHYDCFAIGPDATHWCEWYKESKDSITSNYNSRAVLLENVELEENLFGSFDDSSSISDNSLSSCENDSSIKAAVTLAQYGSGTLSFIGDVSLDDDSLKIIATVARGQG